MKKQRHNQKKLQMKRARKAAKRRVIVKEKRKHHLAIQDKMNRMSEDELKEFLGEEEYQKLIEEAEDVLE